VNIQVLLSGDEKWAENRVGRTVLIWHMNAGSPGKHRMNEAVFLFGFRLLKTCTPDFDAYGASALWLAM